ncbi:beta-1,3-N-acetylglucosaminyltransferase radical fringe-like [Dysidea avara]|uniref:beta-1,3-N-acetylglucosaminyltransferase radical fringe-like n=1 Tax=Dysidea avara TaxID=196820 RepID=UPI003324E06D
MRLRDSLTECLYRGLCICFLLGGGAVVLLMVSYSHRDRGREYVPRNLPLRSINSQLIAARSSPDILSNVYISVKTTPKYYDSRLSILKKTWFQKVDKEKFTIVSDHFNESFVDLKLFEEEVIKEGFHLVTTKCQVEHHRKGLCCKSGVEYEQFYNYLERHKSDSQQVQWYCHFDDDIYVNVKELSNLLSKYDPSKPYYIGRYPRRFGFAVDSFRFGRLKNNYNVSRRIFWYSAGATYCVSLALMMKLEKYFNGVDKFQHTCAVSEYTDDLSVGAIINLVLGYNITHIDNMYNQATDLKKLSPEAVSKLVTVGFSSGKTVNMIDPQPRLFTSTEDPTRFLTYHCLLYKDTSWCNTEQ